MVKRRGFTLAEIMVVTAITGILLAIASPGLRHAQIKAREAKLKADLKAIRDAMEQFNNDTGTYPGTPAALSQTTPVGSGWRTTAGGGMTLVPIPPGSWRGPYLKAVPTPDPMFTGSPAGFVHSPHGWVYDSGVGTLQQNWLQAPSTAISTEGTPYNTW